MTTQRAWRRPPGAPTLTQIARAAGVPVPVVSKVLNGRSDVSPATRQAVASRLRQAGYAPTDPDPAAGSAPGAAATPTGQLDLVVAGIEGSWANALLWGFEGVIAKAGFDVVVVVAREASSAERDWVQRLVDRGSRGAVLALVTPTDSQYRRLAVAGVHLVVLDPNRPPAAGIPTVGATNWTGGRQAGEHLTALGHTRVAAIGGTAHQQYSQARLDGFRSALAASDPGADAVPVRYGNWNRADAAGAARRLLDHPAVPTAIFACSDLMALGVFDAAAERGLRIPRDLSVVGFDDLPEAGWLDLTTIRQPVREMAESAAATLLRLVAGEDVPTPRIELETRLVERGSTGPPR